MAVVNFFDGHLDDLATEIGRIKSLIETCIHLLPEAPSEAEFEDEVLVVLGVTQNLIHNLEGRIRVEQSRSTDLLEDPRSIPNGSDFTT